ncbi:MAG: IS3 family transposase [Acidimicrobiales bacterium]
MTRYRWIDSQKAAGYPVRVACRVAEVSSSAYYDYCARRDWGPTEADWDEALLANEIWEVHHRHDDTYGSPRMTGELRRRGYCVNHKRTERLMATLGIYARDGRRKKIRTTIPDREAPPIPDRIGRDFSVGEPGRRACGDITYIHTDEGWLYLADVEDIGSRRVIGFAMADHMRTELVSAAMTMALECRGGSLSGLTFHHDRGSQYMGREFRGLCDRLGVVQSTGRTGTSLDNAAAESLWASLKRELVSRVRFATREEARRAITAWINRYNTVRLHSSLGNVPPVEWELRYSQAGLLAA